LIGELPAVYVSSFKNENDAKKYMKSFTGARRTINHLNKHTFFIITEENFTKLIMGGNLEGYLKFYTDYY